MSKSEVCGKNREIREEINKYRKDILSGDENNAICFDGIIDEKSWWETKIKLAFLLKETNYTEDRKKREDWEYLKWIYDISERKTSYPTFRNISMWTSLFYDFFEKGEADKEKYIENGALKITDELWRNLKKTAVVNLKKSWGSSTSNWNILNEHLQNKNIRSMLRKEIELTEADVVLCGSTEVFDFAVSIWGGEKKSISTSAGNTLCYFKSEETIFVKFYHPACRKKREEMFDYAKDIFATLKSLL